MSQLQRLRVVQYLGSNLSDFKIESLANREPVQAGQDWRDVLYTETFVQQLERGCSESAEDERLLILVLLLRSVSVDRDERMWHRGRIRKYNMLCISRKRVNRETHQSPRWLQFDRRSHNRNERNKFRRSHTRFWPVCGYRKQWPQTKMSWSEGHCSNASHMNSILHCLLPSPPLKPRSG